MYKYEITLYDKSVISATSSFSCSALGMANEIENKSDFITIGDVTIRKTDIQYIREVKIDE